jgi:hypothetical protein
MRLPATGGPFVLSPVLPLVLAALLPAQNSTRKIRQPPSATAQRAGSAVPWRDSLEAALAEAKEQKKLVFWYVPTVTGSPMDRKPEIDRYLRSGPFSWPTTITLLQTKFVPVMEVPRGEAQKRFGLQRNVFLEPGYLVLDGEGKVKAKVDQLTTFQPEWFEAPLRRLVGAPSEGFPCAPALREAWDAYRSGERVRAIELAEALLQKQPADATAAEAHWLVGAALCRDNHRREAETRWQLLADQFPDQPLGWKAAMEAEDFGAFVHGFEDYLPLPVAVLRDDPTEGTRARGVYAEDELWARSVAFLLSMDDGDGVVRDSIYDFGGTDSLPNVYAAVTCLVGQALLAADRRIRTGALKLGGAQEARLQAMLERIRVNSRDDAWLALSDRDEILWARAYSLRFQVQWQQKQALDAEGKAQLQRAVAALLALQPDTGVWFHEYGNPFAIATALIALHDGKAAGAEVDAEKIDKGLRALAMNRTDQGAFTYGHTSTGKPRESLEAAAGRMPLCELAMFLFGHSDQEKLQFSVATGLRHHDLMAAVRKYDDHADKYHYGGFFFWFDMLGRAEAIMQIADVAVRDTLRAQQKKLVLDLPEFDGCFVDCHELGRCYGTAMALLCLDALGH